MTESVRYALLSISGLLFMCGLFGLFSMLAYMLTFRDELTKTLMTRAFAASFLLCLVLVPAWEMTTWHAGVYLLSYGRKDLSLIALPFIVAGNVWLIIKRKNGVKFFGEYDSGAEGENEALAGGAGGALHSDSPDN